MPNIDWSYHRNGCVTCKRMKDYLETVQAKAPKTEVDARKERYQDEKALELINQASKLKVAKGQKRVEVNLKKDRPADDVLLKLVLGPTGNLRAPTLMIGKTMVVGFNEDMLNEIFAKKKA